MKKLIPLSFLLLFIALPAPTVQGGVLWQAGPSVKTAAPPLDVAVSADGKRTFVLTEGGQLAIYNNADGSNLDTIKVDPALDRLSVTGDGGWLFLTSRENGTLTPLALDYQFDLDYTDSPFLGKADAPVVLAFFSDFQ